MIQKELLDYLKTQKEPLSFEQIKRGFKHYEGLVSHHLIALVDDGKVKKIPRGDEFVYKANV